MRRFRPALVLAIVAALALSTVTWGAAPVRTDPSSDSTAVQQLVDTSSAIVQLKGDPLSTYAKTKPPAGKKIDFSSNTVKAYRAQLNQLRNDFKKWLQANAPRTQVTGQFEISLNAVAVQLNGTSLDLVRAAPQVQSAEYEGLYYPTEEAAVDPDLAIINATEAWGAGGSAGAGAGVKVAIVDTGIDFTHPCFSDAGYPAQKQLGDTRFTNNKVIVAKVFNMKTPGRGYTPEALQEHGTHVAGTVACNYGTAASVDGAVIPHPISGVAPAALLGNYNVFPGDVLNAHSEDIMNALEAAYADGFDVANLSLGGNASGTQDLLSMAINDLDQAGMVVAVAAGNSATGNADPPHLLAAGHYTIESPGSAERALTAGAATVGHFIATPFTVDGVTYPVASGSFATVTADLTAPLGVVTGGTAATGGLDTACSALPAGSLSGEIALISRGTCTFSQKIRDAQDAGAVAAIVVNNTPGDPIAMGLGGIPNEPTIPAYMVSVASRTALMADDGKSATIGATLQYFVSGDDDVMAAFSSQGPTDVTYRVKPDVVAPGVNVLSSIPHQFCDTPPCFAFFQGTSMATPHLAGSAAVVIGQHRDWSSAEVRSAIVNTADRTALKDGAGAPASDVNVSGAGREDLLAAVNASVALDPVSISFGSVPSGSGQGGTFSLTLTNLGASGSFSLAIANTTGSGVVFTVPSGAITIAAGGSATVTIAMSETKGAAGGDRQAMLLVSRDGDEVAHAAVYVFVK